MRKGCALIAALLLLSLSGCAERPAPEAPELLVPVGVSLDTQRVARGDFYRLNVYDGEVVPYVEDLRFEMDGVFLEMLVIPGEMVLAGDALARLDESVLQEQYDALAEDLAYDVRRSELERDMLEIDLEIARLTLEQATARYAQEASEENLRAMLAQRAALEMLALSIRQADQARTLSFQAQQHRLDGDAAQLGRNTIFAPFDGRVVYTSMASPGQRVLVSEPVVFLADETRLSLQSAYVPQGDLQGADDIYARVGGRDYAVTPNPVDMNELISRMIAGVPMEITYEFDELPEGLACGQYAAIHVVTGLQKDVLLIPANALYSDGAGRYVYRMENGGRVRQPVVTGATNGAQTIVKEGLSEGDEVYVKE